MTWIHRQSYQEFEDFDTAIFVMTDALKSSLDANLSFDCEQQVVHLTLTWNDDHGDPRRIGEDQWLEWNAAIDLVRPFAPLKVLERLDMTGWRMRGESHLLDVYRFLRAVADAEDGDLMIEKLRQSAVGLLK